MDRKTVVKQAVTVAAYMTIGFGQCAYAGVLPVLPPVSSSTIANQTITGGASSASVVLGVTPTVSASAMQSNTYALGVGASANLGFFYEVYSPSSINQAVVNLKISASTFVGGQYDSYSFSTEGFSITSAPSLLSNGITALSYTVTDVGTCGLNCQPLPASLALPASVNTIYPVSMSVRINAGNNASTTNGSTTVVKTSLGLTMSLDAASIAAGDVLIYSDGVGPTVVPEPSAFAMFLFPLGCLLLTVTLTRMVLAKATTSGGLAARGHPGARARR